jgi:hypothetical protein
VCGLREPGSELFQNRSYFLNASVEIRALFAFFEGVDFDLQMRGYFHVGKFTCSSEPIDHLKPGAHQFGFFHLRTPL